MWVRVASFGAPRTLLRGADGSLRNNNTGSGAAFVEHKPNMGKGGSGGVSEYDAYWCPTSFINSALATRKEFEESLKFPAGKRAMLERAARGIPEKSASEVKITTALTKQTLKRGGSDAIDSIQTALATDKDFLALSAVYKEAGAVKVAQKMAAGFLLAAVNPTAKECKVSLQSSMEEMAREAKSPGAISVDAVFGVPLTTYPCRITKQMVNRADSSTLAGIMTAFGGDTSFEELMRKELLELWGKYMAAKQLADEFLLAVATPTAEEVPRSCLVFPSRALCIAL